MRIISVVPRGYCKGVVNAIEMAKQARIRYPDKPIYILGMLVHNQYVVNALNEIGIVTLDDFGKSRMELLDEISSGVVIFSAHGVSKAVFEKALSKGLEIVDATCVDVRKTQQIISDFSLRGYDIFYIGVKGHPEAEAVMSISEKVHLVSTESDIAALNLDNSKILLTNQTTMSLYDIANLIDQVKEKYPNALVFNEICQATRIRQEAVMNLSDVDLLFVVGDPKSNNTRNLAKIAGASVKKVVQIENVSEIDPDMLNHVETVAVTSGASTPTALTNQVIDYLKNYRTHPELPPVVTEIL